MNTNDPSFYTSPSPYSPGYTPSPEPRRTEPNQRYPAPQTDDILSPEMQRQPPPQSAQKPDNNIFSTLLPQKKPEPEKKLDNMFAPEINLVPEPKTVDNSEELVKEVEDMGINLNNLIMHANAKITRIIDAISSGEKCNVILDTDKMLDEVQSLVYDIKSITTSFELFTDKHIHIIRKKYKEEMLNSIDSTMLSIVLNVNNNNYKDRLFTYINMINHFVSLSSLIFKCSDSWFGNQEVTMEMKRNIYLYLDFFQHNISFIITQELYYKKYSLDANLNEVQKWNKDSVNRKLQKEGHFAILNNEYKKSKTACVIS